MSTLSLPTLLLSVLTLTLTRSWVVQGLGFRYLDGDELAAFLTNVSVTYPDITRLYTIGKSVNQTDLWVLAIGENPRDHVTLRPNVKYIGGIHGSEVIGRANLLHLVELLVTSYGHDDVITRLLNTTTIHILPDMNPDGNAAANSSACLSRYIGRVNANGIDLNRNFPDHFRPGEEMGAIQPETRAIMNWIQSTQFALSASFHGGALVTCYPFDNYLGNGTEGMMSRSPDHDMLVHLAMTYASVHPSMKALNQCDYFTFEDGICNGADWYPLTGGMGDYSYLKAGCVEITVEASCCMYPPQDQLQHFWDENRQSMLDLLHKVHIGVKGIVRDTRGRPVEGAVVWVEGREMVTSRTTRWGEYWRLLLPGYYRLQVAKDGCRPKTVLFQVHADQVTRLDVTINVPDDRDSNAAVSVFGSQFLGVLVLVVSLYI